MSKNTFTLSIVCEIPADAEQQKFGCPIVSVSGMPAGFAWTKFSAMASHNTLPVKSAAWGKKQEAAPVSKKVAAAPVAVASEAGVQAMLAQPGVADFLASLMKASGAAPVAADTTPTLAAARKPGRPRKA